MHPFFIRPSLYQPLLVIILPEPAMSQANNNRSTTLFSQLPNGGSMSLLHGSETSVRERSRPPALQLPNLNQPPITL